MREKAYREEEYEDGVDDANTITYDTDRKGEQEFIYPAKNIKIDRVQFSIFELKRRYDRGDICLDPDFQRNDVWTARQRAELIESVMMGIPLPLIYLAETMDSKLVIVDGRQRLTTFFQFLDNKFTLKNLRILRKLNGYRFQDLIKEDALRGYAAEIEDFQLVIQIIKYPTPDRVRFDIFDRVNRGGTPLNNQEMRNALYQGAATKFLNKLADSAEFQKATGGSISPKHMKDKYIILRAVSFYLWRKERLTKKNKEIVSYRSDIEEFLGYAMEYLNRIDETELSELSELFCRVMRLCYTIGGTDVFRLPASGTHRRPVSMTLFESLFFFAALLDEDQVRYHNEDINTKLDEMFEDSVFLEALTYNVDSAVHVNVRFAFAEKKYKEIADAYQNFGGRI